MIIGLFGRARQGQVAVVAAGSVPTTRTVGMVEKTLSTVTLNCLERDFHWFTRRPSGLGAKQQVLQDPEAMRSMSGVTKVKLLSFLSLLSLTKDPFACLLIRVRS